jgi:hypothetical protein
MAPLAVGSGENLETSVGMDGEFWRCEASRVLVRLVRLLKFNFCAD